MGKWLETAVMFQQICPYGGKYLSSEENIFPRRKFQSCAAEENSLSSNRGDFKVVSFFRSLTLAPP